MTGVLRARLGESLGAVRAVFANPGLRRVESAWALSETGKWLYIVALAVFAFDHGGATAVGIVALIRVVPSAVLAPFAALLADRYRRERVMLWASLARAVLFGAAAALVVLEVPAGAVFAIAGVVTVLSTTFRPAQSALLPSLARSPEELTAANVATSTIASAGSFLGPALGGVLLAATNVETVFAATGATFLLSAVLVAAIGGPRPERVAPQEAEGVVREALAGFRTIATDANLRVLVGLYAAQTLVAGALMVLIVVVAFELLDMGDSGVGYLNAAFGAGGLVGAGLTLVLVARRRLASDFALGMLLWGLPLVLMGIWAEPALALVLLALIGVGDTVIEVAAPTLLQRAVPDEVLGRVFGALESLLIGAMGVGAIVAPALIDALGARGALIATGALLPVLGLVFWRRLAAIDRAAVVPAHVELLRAIPIFAPLQQPALERLALSLVPAQAFPGEPIFRQGDRGDRFYVIGEGEVEVSIDGRAVRTEGPGEYFGEIALLRDVPRTATVTARTKTALYALERDEFLSAVTGHVESREAAEAVVSARLAGTRTALATE